MARVTEEEEAGGEAGGEARGSRRRAHSQKEECASLWPFRSSGRGREKVCAALG